MTKAKTIEEYLQFCPTNKTVMENMIKLFHILSNPKYKATVDNDGILVTVSMGSDSCVVIDLLEKLDLDIKIRYVFFDTGLEYQATKDHIKYIEDKYNINIEVLRPKKPIPLAVRDHGQPFLSKRVSEMIDRLQKHGFNWEDDTYENLVKKYPRCQAALKWWCNEYGENSSFNINRNTYLKEFMIKNPPTFKIASKCCKYAKKDLLKDCLKNKKHILNVSGVRKSEGGTRATAYKNCYDGNRTDHDNYRPLFFYTNKDKEDYANFNGVEYSLCYKEYGLKRTGCSGCPYGRDYKQELEIIQQYEPKLYKAVMNIFGDSYQYTEKYREYQKEQRLLKNPNK